MPPPTVLPRDDSMPGDLPGFLRRFSDEATCAEVLRRWKYPEGFRCPGCGGSKAWHLARRALDECAGCGRQVSLTAGTLFHKSDKPLSLWFHALYLFVVSKRGVSASELSRALSLRLATAWTWLQKMRSALGRRAAERLQGIVEVDETYEGGVERGVPGRGAVSKALVGGAVEVEGEDQGIGRARLRVLRNASAKALASFVNEVVDPQAGVLTDGWAGYNDEALAGRAHAAAVIRGSGKEAHEALPVVHRVFSLLHRVLLGTHQGAVQPKHLPGYLAEFEFRFNRRHSASRALLFQRLLSIAVTERPPEYWRIVGRKRPRRPSREVA